MPVPVPDPSPGDCLEADRQPDLFDGRGRADVRSRREHPVRPGLPAPASLGDDELAGRFAEAGPLEIDALCAEVVARPLPAAVPALEALWRRFHGFGIHRPLREQCAMLETLARLEGSGTRAALRRIVLSAGLPASLLPIALRSTADARVVLPAAFVADFPDHDDPALRRAAFDLAPGAKVPAPRLREGLSDRDLPIRLAAAALAHRGDASGRDVPIAELTVAPSTALVEALGALGDDAAIVSLGRCAMRRPEFAPVAVAVLCDMGNPRADRLAARLEAGPAGPGEGAG